jgi:hypothetical protein
MKNAISSLIQWVYEFNQDLDKPFGSCCQAKRLFTFLSFWIFFFYVLKPLTKLEVWMLGGAFFAPNEDS